MSSLNATVDTLSDDIIATIMSFAALGTAPGEIKCPAAKFACVSKRWYKVYTGYAKQFFVTNPLRRINDWTIESLTENDNGGIKTTVDSWVRPRGSRVPCWWTSGYDFRGGQWTGNPYYDSAGGPFPLKRNTEPPRLLVTFSRPIKLRALAFAARNRPRKIRLYWLKEAQANETNVHDQFVLGAELKIPPPVLYRRQNIQPAYCDGIPFPLMKSTEYMELVARELPQGSHPSPEALSQHCALPVVLKDPLPACKTLCIQIHESHERGWVGINHMSLFE